MPAQLFMQFDLDGELPPVVVPDGYGLRTYETEADDEAWVHIMNNSVSTGNKYTIDGFRKGIQTAPQFRPELMYFVTCNGEAVGSATAWRQYPEETRVGYVHMVGVLSEHRGKGLGRLVTLRAMHYFKEHAFEIAILRTDDFRLAAIKTYLALGFRPSNANPTHPDRWLEIFQKLEAGRAAATS